MILEYIKLSINELINNKLRSFLSLIGIVIGVAVVFIIFSISDITNAAITNEISGTNGVFSIFYTKDKNDTVEIFRQSLGFGGNAATSTNNYYDLEIIDQASEIEGVAGAMGNYSTTAQIRIGTSSLQSEIQRYNEEYLNYHELKIVYGKDIYDYPEETRHNLVLLSENMLTNYLEIPVEEAVGKKILVGSRELTVAGVIDDEQQQGAVTVFSKEAYDSLFLQSTLNSISIKIEVGYPTNETAQKAVDYLNYAAGYSDEKGGYVLEDLSFLTNQIKVVTGILSLVMGVIASISLLVAGIGVMNIMLVSVVERTREIGVKRAIGANKGAIQFQFIVESCLLTFIGGVIGVLIGIVVVSLTLKGLNMDMPLNMSYVIFALIFSISLGLMFGYLPSRRAAELNIIEAIQSE